MFKGINEVGAVVRKIIADGLFTTENTNSVALMKVLQPIQCFMV